MRKIHNSKWSLALSHLGESYSHAYAPLPQQARVLFLYTCPVHWVGWWAVRQAPLHALLKSVCFVLFHPPSPPVVFIRLQVSSWMCTHSFESTSSEVWFLLKPILLAALAVHWRELCCSLCLLWMYFLRKSSSPSKAKTVLVCAVGLSIREWTVLYNTYALGEGVILQHIALQWALPSILDAN